MARNLIWHGHANFQFTYEHAGQRISLLFDPFFTGNPKAQIMPGDIEKPDIILVTHNHGDHAGDAAQILKDTGALLATGVGIADDFLEAGVSPDQVINGHGFNIGGTMSVKGVAITITQAFHTIAGVAPIGFIVTLPDGFTIYHAGDTGIFGSMALLGELYAIDLALLPAGSVYTMDKRQAAMAAKLLGCKAMVPMHWGTFPALDQSMDDLPDMLAEKAPACRCILMQPGDRIEL